MKPKELSNLINMSIKVTHFSQANLSSVFKTGTLEKNSDFSILFRITTLRTDLGKERHLILLLYCLNFYNLTYYFNKCNLSKIHIKCHIDLVPPNLPYTQIICYLNLNSYRKINKIKTFIRPYHVYYPRNFYTCQFSIC